MAEWKLTLNNWSFWMSADEYSGGSFFYSEWIDSYSSSKSFKLWHSLWHTEINKRHAWYAVALEPVFELDEEWYNHIGMVSFSSDWYIESNWINRWSSTNWEFWGWIYKRPSGWYVNGLAISNTLLGISNNKIDRFTSLTNLWGSNLVSNPWLTSDTDWTVGAWWTTWASGATHTSWTADLTQTLTVVSWKSYRIVVKATWVTTGTCAVKLASDTVATISSTSDVCILWVEAAWWASEAITFTPTATFDWTIEYVKVQEYDSTKLLPDNITITDYASHPVCLWQWDIYIWSWDKLDIVSTTDRDVRTLSIIDTWYTIINITNQWWNLVIWASNWKDSKQYYWNGVDSLASEVIDWGWNNIAWVITDETKNYVMVSNNWDRRMYVVSWYQRQLIANNVFNWRTIERGREPYNINKRFNFYLSWQNQMALLNDKLYVRAYGGIYVFGGNVPWIWQSWSKPIKWEFWAAKFYPYSYAMNSMFSRMHFSYRSDWINYITQIYEHEYTTKWYLVTTSILWDNISSRKNLTKLKIWFKNIKSTYWNIKVYVIVDDDYFWRYQVTNVTTRPSIWDKYNVWANTVGEIIAIENNWTTGVITFKTTENTANYPWNALSSITRVTGDGQATITTKTLFDNMCLIKTIESDKQEYGDELIFGKSFVETHMPYWRKIQLVIELNSNNSKISPEIFDISLLSDIVDTDV